ncbi:hypothetical protein [Gloeobacter kilaueensis]|uniref:Alpha-ketoglutarate decarboxylase n=1 Tax=Gloeobacter kilaueensis (strain ATCC BAA-2537 / CCAP 1431/1 / ULC 316 / JS1) TaxID=1183438 RepID=U5QIY0_GLOK1|nr:hypothetical protein [Gloeobacter kilaueensis]AGY58861.1 alpha-ketoglutarate decarboxylase [Gloeobacter kilaueensis JS1]
MYPWEKPADAAPQTAGPENLGDIGQTYPWAAAPAERPGALAAPEEGGMPLLSPDEERLVAQITADVPLTLGQPALIRYSASEKPVRWLPLAGVLAATVLFGALIILWLRPAEPPVVVDPTARPSARPASVAPAKPARPAKPVASLIQPSPARPFVEKTLKDGGRTNPFYTAIPAPKPPPPLKPVKQPPPPPPPPPVLSLDSLAVSGSSRAALIRVTSSQSEPSVFEVSVGDGVAGWTVRSITTNQVVLVKGKLTRVLLAQ